MLISYYEGGGGCVDNFEGGLEIGVVQMPKKLEFSAQIP